MSLIVCMLCVVDFLQINFSNFRLYCFCLLLFDAMVSILDVVFPLFLVDNG
jgi:hypothetical protein